MPKLCISNGIYVRVDDGIKLVTRQPQYIKMCVSSVTHVHAHRHVGIEMENEKKRRRRWEEKNTKFLAHFTFGAQHTHYMIRFWQWVRWALNAPCIFIYGSFSKCLSTPRRLPALSSFVDLRAYANTTERGRLFLWQKPYRLEVPSTK